jgi:hypothetical protein
MRGRLKSVAILVFVPVAWGYNWVVMKKALAYAGPFEFSALRFVLASLCLFAVLFLLKRPIRVRPMSGVIWAGLLQTAGNFGLTMWALLTGPAGRSAVLCYTMPFWVVLIAWPLLGERPSRLQWLASAVWLWRWHPSWRRGGPSSGVPIFYSSSFTPWFPPAPSPGCSGLLFCSELQPDLPASPFLRLRCWESFSVRWS